MSTMARVCRGVRRQRRRSLTEAPVGPWGEGSGESGRPSGSGRHWWEGQSQEAWAVGETESGDGMVQATFRLCGTVPPPHPGKLPFDAAKTRLGDNFQGGMTL